MSKPTPIEIVQHRAEVEELFNAMREAAHAEPTSRAKTVLATLDSTIPTSSKLAFIVGTVVMQARRGLGTAEIFDDIHFALDILEHQCYLEDRSKP